LLSAQARVYVSVFDNCDAGRVRALAAHELTLDKSDTYAACGVRATAQCSPGEPAPTTMTS
jgi:hypothetical protein